MCPFRTLGQSDMHGGGGALECLAGVAVDGDVRWGGHVGPSVLLTERGDEAVEGRHRPRVEPVVQVAGVQVHPVGSAERDEADVVLKSQRTRSPGPCLSRPDPSTKFVHPVPMVTKIRAVGVPSTSSTKYVPGSNCSSGVPNSAREAWSGARDGRCRLVGWHGVVPVAGDHEGDRDHDGGRHESGDQDPQRNLPKGPARNRSLENDHRHSVVGEPDAGR